MLEQFVKDHGIVERGSFKLASGRTSEYYVDCRKITLNPTGLYLVARRFFSKFDDLGRFEAVGGPSSGADVIVGGVLLHIGFLKSNWPETTDVVGFLVRKEQKEYGLKKLIEGPVQPGMRCVMVEDVATTGGSLVRAVGAARNFGMEVLAAGVIVNRNEGADEALAGIGVPLISLLNLRDFDASV